MGNFQKTLNGGKEMRDLLALNLFHSDRLLYRNSNDLYLYINNNNDDNNTASILFKKEHRKIYMGIFLSPL